MKQLFLLFLLFPTLVMAQTGDFTFSIPNVGGFLNKAMIGVQNGTPFIAEIIAMDEHVASLRPGESIFGKEPVPFEGMNIPVLVNTYDSQGNFLGTAARNLSLNSGQPTTWTIRMGDIIWANGSYQSYGGYQSPYPAPDAPAQLSKEIDFPRPWYKSTTMIQVVNTNLFTIVVKLNDIEVTRLGPAEIFYHEIKDPGILAHGAVIKVVYLDRGRWVGESDERFFSTTKGPPQAHQFIFGPYDRRQQ